MSLHAINMATHDHKHAFSTMILNRFSSRKSSFYCFIFLMGLSIGFMCAFYLENFYVAFQSSIYSIFPLLPSPPITSSKPSLTLILSSSPPPDANNLTLLIQPILSEPTIPPPPPLAPLSLESNATSKVAFMFLTRGPIPLSPLWELFFKGHKGLFSIYVHTHPSYNDTIPQDSVFYGTRITSKLVRWGNISMIDAEKRLLTNALIDPLNQRFVLLSESCIPLYNFTTIYNYLVNSSLSYINSNDDRKSGRGRYNPQMSPNITLKDWRKGSQWFEVKRDLAMKIAVEEKYYNLFKNFCHPPCYSDEHYLPTMVNILYGKMNSNLTLTYVDWSKVGPHPRKFEESEITVDLLNSIRFGSEDCFYNSNTTNKCKLFARKFTSGTLKPLLTLAPLLYGFNP